MDKTEIDDIESKIAGTWVMKSMSTVFNDEDPEEHEGANGRLSYNTRLKTVFADISRPDDKQDSGMLEFQYAGNYELINSAEIIHHIDWATSSNMIGKDMKREFQINSDATELKITGPSAEYPDAKIVIDWVKVLDAQNRP